MPTKSNNTGGRGGARPGAGRKKSAVKDKAENGNPGGRKLEVLDIPEVEGVAMPKPHDFLSAEQRDGSVLQAQEIYTETWQWLKVRGNDQSHGFSLQASHHGKADPVSVYQHRHQLHEPGGSALE